MKQEIYTRLSNLSVKDQKETLKYLVEKQLQQKAYSKVGAFLINYRYLKLKIEYLGIEALLKDFENSLAVIPKNTPLEKLLNYIFKKFKAISHILKNDPSQLAALLYGYLDETKSPHIAKLKETIIALHTNVWLRSMQPNLDSQQGTIERTIKIGNLDICDFEVSKHQNLLYLAFEKGYVKTIDVEDFAIVNEFQVTSKATPKNIKELANNHLLILTETLDNDFISIWNLIENKRVQQIVRSAKQFEGGYKIRVNNKQNYWAIVDDTQKNKLIVRNTIDFSQKQVLVCDNTINDFEFIDTYTIVVTTHTKQGKGFLTYYQKQQDHFIKSKHLALGIFYNGEILIPKNSNHFFLWNIDGCFCVLDQHINKIHNQFILEETHNNTYINTILPLININTILIFYSIGIVKWYDFKAQKYYKEQPTEEYIKAELLSNSRYAIVDDAINKVELWNLNTGEVTAEILSTATNNKFRFLNADILISTEKSSVSFWNIQHQKQASSLNHNTSINCIKRNGNLVYSGSYDKTLKEITYHGKRIISTTINEAENGIHDIVFFSRNNHTYIAYTSTDLELENDEIYIYNLSLKRIETIFKKHTQFIYGIKVSQLKNILVSMSWDGTICFWNLNTLKHEETIKYTNRKKIKYGCHLYIKNDSELIVTYHNKIHIWDIETKEKIKTLRAHQKKITASNISSDVTLFATADNNDTVIVWDIKQKNIISKFKLLGYITNIEFISLNQDSFILLSYKSEMLLWNIYLNKIEQKYLKHTGQIKTLKIFSDGSKFVSVSYQGEIILWNTLLGQVITVFNLGDQRMITAIELSEDEKTIIIGEYNGQLHFLKIQNL
ncbi:WD40 repeat domain-containing protein [Tenacibaculum xiamenense]|uniref:hypothetical protein n=1 Tax=Tenacibaculum xiamenense TaxID=1261553 RepID=UPI003893639A